MQITRIESEVPFGRALYCYLHVNNLRLDKLTQHGSMEKRYLAWETVRKEMNPFFQTGTGFEGYLVGRCANPEAALDTILRISQNMLDAIARFYRFQHAFQSKLMKTLTREASDPAAIQTWSAYLGSELGKLRAQMILNKEAQDFRTQTYNVIRTLPPVVYRESEEAVFQTYVLGKAGRAEANRYVVTLQSLQPRQQDAWLVAENIGQFGHPLVRQLLDTR
jgi:hypothetical protein